MSHVVRTSTSAHVVTLDRRTVAEIRERRPNSVVTRGPTVAAITQRTSTVTVGSQGTQGPQGLPGPAGDNGFDRIADGAIGGHRIVRSTGAETVAYASNDDADHGDDTVGISLNAADDAGAVTVIRTGTVEHNGWSWTPGLPVFLGTNGALTQTEPVADGPAAFIQEVGHAQSATALFVDIQPPIYF